jgi:alcohol dehydrogenase
MRAAVVHQHGGPEVITFDPDFPDPRPGPGEVLIRVRATSLNYHDVFTRRGMPGIKLTFPMIMGLDLAGEIAELGAGVSGWEIGTRVVVDPVNKVKGGLVGETTHGGLAELCVVPADQLVSIPEGVSYEQAAALPVAFGTARRMLFTNGQIKAGDKVLVLGASGGVGVCCVMLAKMIGAEVIACASTETKLRRLKQLGADHVINYQEVDFVAWVHEKFGKPFRRSYEGGVDVIVNYTGGDTWARSLRALKRGGKLLTCGVTAGFDPKEDLRYVWSFELKLLGSNSWTRADIEALLELVCAEKITVPIDHVFPLERAREALSLLEERNVIGKIVVTP